MLFKHTVETTTIIIKIITILSPSLTLVGETREEITKINLARRAETEI